MTFVYFYLHYSRRWTKNILLQFMSKSIVIYCGRMFSSKSFIVSSLRFRSLIHSEFVHVYGVIRCFNFIFLHVAVQFSQNHLLKRLCLLHCIFLILHHRLEEMLSSFSTLSMMLIVVLKYVAFIMLRHVPSLPTFWRVFIINAC